MVNYIKAALAFIAVCGMVFVVGWVGGAQLGNSDTGLLAALGFAIAILVATVVYMESKR